MFTTLREVCGTFDMVAGRDMEGLDHWSPGRVTAVGRDQDGQLKGGANLRGMQGYAAGR